MPSPRGFTDEQRAKSAATRKARAEDKYLRYLRLLEEGKRIGQAATGAGLLRKDIYHRRKMDPEFAELERQAEEAAAEKVEDALYDAAVGGNVPAAEKWLANRAKDRWRFGSENKVTIENKQTLEIEAGERLERVAALMARLEERKALKAGGTSDIIDVEAEE